MVNFNHKREKSTIPSGRPLPLWRQVVIVFFILGLIFIIAWYFTEKSGQQHPPDWFVNMNRWLGPITLGWFIFIAIGTVFTLFRALVKHLKS